MGGYGARHCIIGRAWAVAINTYDLTAEVGVTGTGLHVCILVPQEVGSEAFKPFYDRLGSLNRIAKWSRREGNNFIVLGSLQHTSQIAALRRFGRYQEAFFRAVDELGFDLIQVIREPCYVKLSANRCSLLTEMRQALAQVQEYRMLAAQVRAAHAYYKRKP